MSPVTSLRNRTALCALLLAAAAAAPTAPALAAPRPDTYQCGWFSAEPLPAEGAVQAPPPAKGVCGLG
jgi:hypothetical protein